MKYFTKVKLLSAADVIGAKRIDVHKWLSKRLMFCILSYFPRSFVCVDYIQNHRFQKIISRIPSEFQIVRIQTRTEVLSCELFAKVIGRRQNLSEQVEN